jgi:hypothetical protein
MLSRHAASGPNPCGNPKTIDEANVLIHRLMQSAWLVNAWAILAAFGTYFCMYMYRKPFTVAAFKQEDLAPGLGGEGFGGDWDQKAVLVSAQVIGYLVSKLVGIRVVSEAGPERRAWTILLLILAALGSLFLFALVPKERHIV